MLSVLIFFLFYMTRCAVSATEICDFELYQNCVEEDGQSATEKCFIEAGCKVQHLNDTSVKKSPGHECRWIIVEKIRDEIQKCVQEKYPKYKLKLQEISKKFKKFCPNRSKRQHIKPDCPKSNKPNCSKNVVREKACDKHKLCLARLSSECQTQFQDARKAICSCASSHLEKRRDEVAKHLSMCSANSTSAIGKASSEKGKGKGHQHHLDDSTAKNISENSAAPGKDHSKGKGHAKAKAHHGKFDTVSFIKHLYCETKLPCEK
uniref:Uncharacterized protein n=1 Tax=Romanomermis culicivorax TaxID=13658 RepID=A0A915K8H4_ROMCU